MKIILTKQRIREWYERNNGLVYVAFSGGKDSTVLLHLVRSMYPDVKAVYVDTGLEFPEIKDFVKTIENVEIIKPKILFTQVIRIQMWCFPNQQEQGHRRRFQQQEVSGN